MFTMDLIFLFFMGSIAGMISGLLGIGGGVILVPSLLLFFYLLGFEKGVLMHFAIATSLASIVIATFASSCFQIFKKKILWSYVFYFMPGACIGAFIGSYTLYFLSGHLLAKIFSLFLFFLSIYILMPRPPIFPVQKKIWLFPFGNFVGFFSSLLGIGGGILSVPALANLKIRLKNAIAISSLVTFSIAFSSSLYHLIAAAFYFKTTNNTIGYIYFPGFIILGIAAAIFAPLGARLSEKTSNKLLKRIFSLTLFVTAVIMFFT